MNVTNAQANPSIFSTVSEAATSGVNWLTQNSKALAASAGDTINKIIAFVSDKFSAMAQMVGNGLSAVKDTLFIAKEQFSVLSFETKLVAAAALAIAGAVGYVASNVVSSKTVPVVVANPAAPVVAEAAAAPAAAPVVPVEAPVVPNA
jgi:glyceraldehyde-3-phosphate dehydrogenase/erythrose-4-phosphate dehydrogenase